jgi:hypothetical protein
MWLCSEKYVLLLVCKDWAWIWVYLSHQQPGGDGAPSSPHTHYLRAVIVIIILNVRGYLFTSHAIGDHQLRIVVTVLHVDEPPGS